MLIAVIVIEASSRALTTYYYMEKDLNTKVKVRSLELSHKAA